ncbi:MAG: hypothetical protein NTW87_27880 [Planctomycetota bacterium]|nr:hypothetical protein [Planctomycetota bacterium]
MHDHLPEGIGFAVLLCLSVPASAPGEEAAMKWFKGNTHAHSLWSDGDGLPEMVADWYKEHGYAFLILTDHNTLVRGARWRDVTGNQKALDKGAQRFGADWNRTRTQGDKLELRLKTLEDFRAEFEEPGKFLLIEGEEISDLRSVHLTVFNLPECIKPQGGTTAGATLNADIAAVRKAARKCRRPVGLFINHPNFDYALTAEDLIEARDARFVEIANAHPLVRNEGDARHPPVERLWDIANAVRLARLKIPPLLGVADDDTHSYHKATGAVPGQAWVMVRAGELTLKALLAALDRGDFYSSTGVLLKTLDYDPGRGTLTVEVRPSDGAEYTISFVGTRDDADIAGQPVDAVGKDGKPLRVTQRYSDDIGKTLAVVKGPRATYKLTGGELYVRAVVRSNRPSSRKNLPEQAWTQPVGWEKKLATHEQVVS